MRFQVSIIILVVLATNAYALSNFFDRLRNGGLSLENQATNALGTKLTNQLNELTYNIMPKTSSATGELVDAIQNDLSQINTKLQNAQLNADAKRDVNEMVDDIKGFISTLSTALDQGISNTYSDVMNRLLKILPDLFIRIFSLTRAGVQVDNLFSSTWKEIGNAKLLKAILSDLNPSNLMSSIRKQTDGLGGIGGIFNNLNGGLNLGLNDNLSSGASSLLNQLGLGNLTGDLTKNLSKTLGNLLNILGLGGQSGQSENDEFKYKFGNVRDRFGYSNFY